MNSGVLSMVFSKSFPKTEKKSVYPSWEEIYLSNEEESLEEQRARVKNIEIMKRCIDNARILFKEKNLKDYQTDIINVACYLFDKEASHAVYWKENKCKEKFDEKFKKS